MRIRKYLGILLVPAALLLWSGIPGFAKNSWNINLAHAVVLNGTTLPAGQYAVRWEAQSPQASVEFVRGKKVVATTQCRLEDRGKRYDSSSVVYGTTSDGTNTLSEIRLAGSSQVLVFNP